MSQKVKSKSRPKQSVGACQSEENQDQIPKAHLNMSKQLIGKSFGEEKNKVIQARGVLQPSTKAKPSAKKKLQVPKKKEKKSVVKQTKHHLIEGVYIVFCIGTSASMKCHNAFHHAKMFVDDFLSALKKDFERKRWSHFTSLVTFGKKPILRQDWTKDVSKLSEAIANLTLSGDGDLALGLEYSKNFANRVTKEGTTRTIIVITDGKGLKFDYGNKNECSSRYKRKEVADIRKKDVGISREKKVVADIRKTDVGIKFVCVGDPNIKLLEKINGRGLEKHTSGREIAKEILLKFSEMMGFPGEHEDILKQMKGFCTSELEDIISACNTSINDPAEDKDVQKEHTMMLPLLSHFADLLPELSLDFKDDRKSDALKIIEKLELAITVLKKMINSSSYDELQKMQEHAPIGCRVRRGRDWMWADQDNGGPGTVVGHLYDELRKYWCWVEWDIGGEINVYRWDMDGKCDLTIVDEDRQPEEEEILMVGCKVAPGEGYEGNPSHVIGIAIKYLDDNKMQVRWEDDGSRENLTYGKDGTPKQLVLATDKGIRKQDHENCESEIENPIVYDDIALENKSMPAPPETIEVYDILENTANVRWQKCRDDKMSSNSKYVVTYVQKSRPHKKMVVKVVAAVSCILDDLKPASEYSVGVKFVNDDGKSLPIKTSFTTRETDTDDSCYEDWKLTDKDASRLSGAIGMNWEILGPPLGIKNVELHHIIQDNNTSVKRVYHMLLEWVRKDKNNSFGNFCKILKTHPSVCFDRDVFSEMRKEHQK